MANLPVVLLAFRFVHSHDITEPDLVPFRMSIAHEEGAELDEFGIGSL